LNSYNRIFKKEFSINEMVKNNKSRKNANAFSEKYQMIKEWKDGNFSYVLSE